MTFLLQVGWTGTAADKVGAGRIMVIDADGSNLRALTSTNDRFPPFSPGGVFPTLHGDVTPAWSPDGKRVALASQSEPYGDFEIVTVRAADGEDRQRLTSVAHEQHVTVAWQPV
jgi:Tol biopolymer transport system component